MKSEQVPVAEWMRDVMERRHVSARAWAERAKLGKDTVSRAIRDDYQHVTTTATIAKLAEALNERAPGAAAGVPSADALAQLVDTLHQVFAGEPLPPHLARPLGAALRDTLLHLADETGGSDDPQVVRALARASARRFQPQAD